MTMTIKQIADRSGFSTPTLRYYEEIGLLPPAARTPAGYRTYDERTVDRLAFIARAKQLGCTLDEIADLSTAWEGGRCGPIQDRLRTLVAAKRAAADDNIEQLVTLAAELQRAADQLERHRPEGPCDSECGCVSQTSDGASVGLGNRPASTPATLPAPIACTLQPGELRTQLADWDAALSASTARVATERGVRIELGDATDVERLAALVVSERRCCGFLEFAITVDDRGIGLEVSGAPDARDSITAIFGAGA